MEHPEPPTIDLVKSRKIAKILFDAYSQKEGVFKQYQWPPEYNLPSGMRQGSEEQLLFSTLTVSLDYMRDANKLWKQSHDAWINQQNRWIFNPKIVVEKQQNSLIELFKNINDQRPTKDAGIWFTICKELLKSDGSIYNLLKSLDFDAVKVSDYLDSNKKHFPYLGGYKIKPLWLRIINDTVGIQLKRIKEIPIPVDVHTARVTLKLIFNETLDGEITKEIRERTQRVWESILEGTGIYPLQLDEPLWLLGKYELLNRFLQEHNLCE